MIQFLSKLAPLPFYPLGLSILLSVAAGVLVWYGRRRPALGALGAAVGVLYLFSTPLVSWSLVRSLEKRYDPQPEYPASSAILLLGGGSVPALPPRIYPETNWFGDRITHAARLHRMGVAPYIIPSGGVIAFLQDQPTTEAWNSAWLLTHVYGIDSAAIILEEKAQNTHDHAPLLSALLNERNLSRNVTVVTSAVHMHRSVKVLRKAGFTVTPAPTDYHAHASFQIRFFGFIPHAYALNQSTMALHEYYGLLAYKVLGWL